MRKPPSLPAAALALAVLALSIFGLVVSHPARAMSVNYQTGSTPIGTGTASPVGSGTAVATSPPLAAYPVFPAPNHKAVHRTVHAIVVGKHFVFRPSTMKVALGTDVIWRNSSGVRGTVTSIGRNWTFSAVLKPMGSAHYVFTKAGTFNYRSTLHHGLTGKIVVTR